MLIDFGGFPGWLSMLAMQFGWLCWRDVNAYYSCFVGLLY